LRLISLSMASELFNYYSCCGFGSTRVISAAMRCGSRDGTDELRRERAMSKIGQLTILVLSLAFIFTAGPASGEESVTVPACGLTPGITQGSYSGLVEITVSGSIVNVPPANGSDGFYGIVNGVLVGPAPGEFRLARASASSNTCEVQSTVHFPVSDFLVDPYPQPDPSHIYTVLLDIGDPHRPVDFRYPRLWLRG